jgi:hypothetical protein
MGMERTGRAGPRPAVIFGVVAASAFLAGYLVRGVPGTSLDFAPTPATDSPSHPDGLVAPDSTLARSERPLPRREDTLTPGVEREQQTLAINRLTSPYLECPGIINSDLRLTGARRRVADLLQDLRAGDPGLSVSLYARDLNNGPWIGIDQDEAYPPASLSKVPVMLYILSAAESDPELLGRTLTYPGPARMPSKGNMDWAPPELRMVPGQAYTYEDLLYRMIALSDNHARDLLLTQISEADLAGMMASLHAEEIHTGGRVLMTPRALSTYFRVLYNSTLLGRAMSEYGLALLSDSFLEDGLRKYLPPEITVASKFGFTHAEPPSTEVHFHECGIVYQPGSPYILCVMTRSASETADDLVEIVARVSRIVWEEETR